MKEILANYRLVLLKKYINKFSMILVINQKTKIIYSAEIEFSFRIRIRIDYWWNAEMTIIHQDMWFKHIMLSVNNLWILPISWNFTLKMGAN